VVVVVVGVVAAAGGGGSVPVRSDPVKRADVSHSS